MATISIDAKGKLFDSSALLSFSVFQFVVLCFLTELVSFFLAVRNW